MSADSAYALTDAGRSRQVEPDQLFGSLHDGMAVHGSQNNKIGIVFKFYPPVGPDKTCCVRVGTGFLAPGHTRLSPTKVHTLTLYIPSDYLRLAGNHLERTVERAWIDQIRMGTSARPGSGTERPV
jgi:hypothetical protein